jgi:hypothetical protein
MSEIKLKIPGTEEELGFKEIFEDDCFGGHVGITFKVIDEEWQTVDGQTIRVIKKAELLSISIIE